MGGFSQFLHGSMTRKNKKHRGFETPRSSLELPVPAEAFQSYYAYCCDETQDLSTRKSASTDASVENLIDEEFSKNPKTKQNAPNIVARLMGMDILSSNTRLVAQPLDKKNEVIGVNDVEDVPIEKESGALVLRSLKSPGKELHWDCEYGEICSDNLSKRADSKMPFSRVHPQEKELQQFKKEFEAWQAARFMECARVIELGNIPEQWLAQLDLTKEKMALYQNSIKSANESMKYVESYISKSRSLSRGDFQYNGYKKEQQTDLHRRLPVAHGPNIAACQDGKMYTAPPLRDRGSQPRETYASRNKSTDGRFVRLSMMESNRKPDEYHTPTRIVILKPGRDSVSSIDESWVSSSGSTEDRDSIEDLLEGMKERLKYDMIGETAKNIASVRGGGIETPFKERLSNSKQTAHWVAEQVVECAHRELGPNLLPSESTRLYRSEMQAHETGSPEFISRDTRKFLSDRLRNALYGENLQDTPNVSHSSPRLPTFDNVRGRLEEARDILSAESGRSYWNDMNYQTEAHTRSFRHQLPKEGTVEDESSPRNLVRSLSAPVSGTSLAKLLLEDRLVVSGAHLRRKHEALENSVGTDAKSRKKDKFNFREKVSNIRCTLKGKLFTRKFQSNHQSPILHELDLVNYPINGQEAMMDYGDKLANFTEVPPSPASVHSSSAHEEFWKVADHPSPLSISEVTSVGDQSVGHVFRDISSNLAELRKQLNQLDHDGSEGTTVTEEYSLEGDLVGLEDEAESFVRDLLVASGLYHGTTDKSFTRCDPLAKPISTRIFELVKAAGSKEENENVGQPVAAAAADEYDKRLQQKLLFDMLNEALSTIFQPRVASYGFRTNSMIPTPQGSRLFEKAWNIIRGNLQLYPSTDKTFYSVEDIVGHDLCSAPWSTSHSDEDVNAAGRDLECRIISELVEEIVEDLL
ncbi:hypothetical protein Dimus_017427 [Dionaea muscipula]